MPRAARPRRPAAARRPRTPRKSRRRRSAAAAVAAHAANAGVFLLTAAAALAAFAAFHLRDLPRTDGLWGEARPPRITLLAADGSPLTVQGESVGAPVRLADLPAQVPLAVLAVEDRNFRHHIGVNPMSVARALFVNASEGEIVQGGSTISQQLAKNLFLSSDRTIKRKIQELFLALWLEQRFTKDEILTLYLNRVYFGAGAYGVDAASYRYFGKPARALELGEAAVLAGLLKAPSRYNPARNPESAGQRGRLVLDAMVEANFLDPFEAERARAEPVRIVAPRFAAAPYFVDYVLQEVSALAAGVDADLVVQTTFDPRVQGALEAGLSAGASMSPLGDGVEVAAVILDRGGAVRAMIGGANYERSQFNRATQARRQTGSAFKPFVFLAGLEAGLDPADLVHDGPVEVEKWRPGNFRDKYYGDVTLTEALARSLNSAAVRVQEHVGRARVRATARRMGLDAATLGPSLALGVDEASPLALAGAYAPLANGGWRSPPRAIDSIRTADGELVWRRPDFVEEAASPEAVAALNRMLEAVIDWGTGRAAAVPGFIVAGKTGTTQGGRDAWFAGHAGGLVGVVWVGRDDNRPVADALGGGAPAIIWREAMARALAATVRRPPQPVIAPALAAPRSADAAG